MGGRKGTSMGGSYMSFGGKSSVLSGNSSNMKSDAEMNV